MDSRLTLLLAALALALTCASCGGGDTAKSPPGSAENPLTAVKQADERPTGGVNEAGAAPAAAGEPGYRELVDHQAAAPRKRFTPCNLVSASRTAAIVGEALAPPLEASQGPTCIYRSKRGEQALTVAVLAMDFDKLRRTLHSPAEIEVGGETGYCSRRAQNTLWVPLGGDRVLSVGAACGVATQFATAAVRRLSA